MEHYLNEIQIRQFRELTTLNPHLANCIQALATALSFHKLTKISEDPLELCEDTFNAKVTKEVAYQLREQVAGYLTGRHLWAQPFQGPDPESLVGGYSKYQLATLANRVPSLQTITEAREYLLTELHRFHNDPEVALNLEIAIAAARPVVRGLPPVMLGQQQVAARYLYRISDTPLVVTGQTLYHQVETVRATPAPGPSQAQEPPQAQQRPQQVVGPHCRAVASPETTQVPQESPASPVEPQVTSSPEYQVP